MDDAPIRMKSGSSFDSFFAIVTNIKQRLCSPIKLSRRRNTRAGTSAFPCPCNAKTEYFEYFCFLASFFRQSSLVEEDTGEVYAGKAVNRSTPPPPNLVKAYYFMVSRFFTPIHLTPYHLTPIYSPLYHLTPLSFNPSIISPRF